ncbi:MAG: hypothetical protein DRN14_07170 [Thermoplasmata archaeon]|nr:MAG: hypothetical protein DRN14_07170 [Thermoplasmata archaeon]
MPSLDTEKGLRGRVMSVEVLGYPFKIAVEEDMFHLIGRDSSFANTIIERNHTSIGEVIGDIKDQIVRVSADIASRLEEEKQIERCIQGELIHEIHSVAVDVDILSESEKNEILSIIEGSEMCIDGHYEGTAMDSENGEFPLLVYDDPVWVLVTQSKNRKIDFGELISIMKNYKGTT